LPKPRTAFLAVLVDPENGLTLDQALTLWFPGPKTVTGEDLVELHLHGGRAVVAATLQSLSERSGLRQAEAGEFTKRAFVNGRIDLAEAEGLADLLGAETEAQRRNAIAQVGGSLHRLTHGWVQQLLSLSARVEAAIDFSDEDDVGVAPLSEVRAETLSISADIEQRLSGPPAERLHTGLRVAIIGPPNSGKSTLLNRLISRDAAIVSSIPGTTRDVIEAPVRLAGLSLIFVDTAGIRQDTSDPIEKIGVERSLIESESADIVLALGGWSSFDTHAVVIDVSAKCDLDGPASRGIKVSGKTGAGMIDLIDRISEVAKSLLPTEDQIALNLRHRTALKLAVSALQPITSEEDELLVAEHLRVARLAIGTVTGGTDAEDMLDMLFGSFCIGK
jgi:tRNA modification GTPase